MIHFRLVWCKKVGTHFFPTKQKCYVGELSYLFNQRGLYPLEMRSLCFMKYYRATLQYLPYTLIEENKNLN